jgi:hypothetical protein
MSEQGEGRGRLYEMPDYDLDYDLANLAEISHCLFRLREAPVSGQSAC